jgi:HSP20 family protein
MEVAMAPTPVSVKKTAPAPMPDPWRSFRSEMDRLFDRFGGGCGFGVPSFRRLFDVEPAWGTESSFSFPTPAVEVTEDDKMYKITAELPGLEQKEVEITLSDDMLILKGEKRYEKEESDRHDSERAYGSFQRSFTLPETIDREKIGADLAKGVLTITLPKEAAAQKPEKKVEINAAA